MIETLSGVRESNTTVSKIKCLFDDSTIYYDLPSVVCSPNASFPV
jgi:hypothetical protein